MAMLTAQLIFQVATPTLVQRAIGGLIFGAVSYVVSGLLAPKQAVPGRITQATIDPTGFGDFVYGQVRRAGTKTYHETTGDGTYYHYFLTLAMHEVEEIGTIYLNDEAVTLDGSGFVTSGGWNSKVLIKKFTGASNQNIYNSLSGVVGKPEQITTSFKGRGIACLYVRLEHDVDVFESGVPTITAVVKGKKVYDPRKDGSLPSSIYDNTLGTDTHRSDDSTTWEYSSNPVLALRDYLTDPYGGGVAHSEIDDAMIATAVAACASTAGDGVTAEENSFEINGALSTGTSRSGNIEQIARCFNGTVFFAQGQFKVLTGAYAAPTITDAFTLDDIRGPITVKPRASRRDIVNTVRGTFVDKDNRWIATEFPQVQLADMSEDNNLESVVDLELPLVTKSAQAQRLAKQILYTSREQIVLTARFSTRAYQLQVGDRINVTIARYGWDDPKVFQVIGWQAVGGNGSDPLEVDLTLKEDSATAYQWSVTEDEYAAILSNNTSIEPITDNLVPSNLQATASTQQQGDGTLNSRLALTWTAPTNGQLSHYVVEWKPSGGSTYNSTTTYNANLLLENLVSGETYNIRVTAYTVRGNKGSALTGSFSATGDTLAPSAPTAPQKSGGHKTATISWTAPTTNSDTPATTLKDLMGYWVYRNTTDSIPANKLAFVSANSFTDGGLADETTYYYWVKAVDFSGNASTALSIGSITTLTAPTGPAGAQGPRGPGRWNISVTTLPTSATAANTAFGNAGLSPVDDDQAWFYIGPESNPTAQSVWIYDGSTWSEQNEVIDGDLIVSGTITTDKIEANAITAEKIDVTDLNSVAISTGRLEVTDQFTLNQSGAQFVAGRTSSSDLTTDGFFIGRQTDSDGSTGFEVSHTSLDANSNLNGVVHNSQEGFKVYNPTFVTGANMSGETQTITATGSSNAVSIGTVGPNFSVASFSALGGGGGGGGGDSAGGNAELLSTVSGTSGTSLDNVNTFDDLSDWSTVSGTPSVASSKVSLQNASITASLGTIGSANGWCAIVIKNVTTSSAFNVHIGTTSGGDEIETFAINGENNVAEIRRYFQLSNATATSHWITLEDTSTSGTKTSIDYIAVHDSSGQPGGDTIVKLYNGDPAASGSLLGTYTAPGGWGGITSAYPAFGGAIAGTDGQDSAYGDGGSYIAQKTAGTDAQGNGAGGGGGGGSYPGLFSSTGYGGKGGNAGSLVNFNITLADLASPPSDGDDIYIVLDTQGAGGAGSTYGYDGGDGSAGLLLVDTQMGRSDTFGVVDFVPVSISETITDGTNVESAFTGTGQKIDRHTIEIYFPFDGYYTIDCEMIGVADANSGDSFTHRDYILFDGSVVADSGNNPQNDTVDAIGVTWSVAGSGTYITRGTHTLAFRMHLVSGSYTNIGNYTYTSVSYWFSRVPRAVMIEESRTASTATFT